MENYSFKDLFCSQYTWTRFHNSLVISLCLAAFITLVVFLSGETNVTYLGEPSSLSETPLGILVLGSALITLKMAVLMEGFYQGFKLLVVSLLSGSIMYCLLKGNEVQSAEATEYYHKFKEAK